MKHERFGFKKMIMALVETLDGVLGMMSLGMSAFALALSPFEALRIIGGIVFTSLLALLAIILFSPKAISRPLKRFIELPIVSKKRCVIFSCIPLALSIFLFVSLFFLNES